MENTQGFVIAISSVFGAATLLIAMFVIASAVRVRRTQVLRGESLR